MDGSSESLTHRLDTLTRDFFEIQRGAVSFESPKALKAVIVAIDDEAIQAERVQATTGEIFFLGRWPWTRTVLAKALETIKSYHPKTVALDMVFDQPTARENVAKELDGITTDSVAIQTIRTYLAGESAELGRTIALQPTTIQGYFEEKEENGTTYKITNLPEVAGANPQMGKLMKEPDSDGLYRQESSESLAFETAKSFTENKLQNTDSTFPKYINYYGPQYTFPQISIVDVLQKPKGPWRAIWNYQQIDFRPEDLKDMAVFIGATATGIYDIRPIPFDRIYPGVEIHATAFRNYLENEFLRFPLWSKILGSVLALSMVFGLFGIGRRSVITMWIAGIAIFATSSIASFYLYQNYFIIFPLWMLGFSIGSTSVITTIREVFLKEKEKAQLKKTLGQYLAPQVMKEVLRDPSKLKLGGERKELTMLFTDLRGFTTLSEKMDAQKLSQLLNEYLTVMTTIIQEHQGTIDKYMGDCIVAFWGAPLPVENAADLAISCSLQMTAALKKFNQEFQSNLGMGIGINTANVSVGNMGSRQIFDYTAIGDGMNFASRLESLTREYETMILISESTQQKITGSYQVRLIDRVKVKGKNEPETIYEVITEKVSDNVIKLFGQAREHYEKGQWADAQRELAEVIELFPNDGPSQTFQGRMTELQSPPKDWNGIWKMNSK